MTEQNTQRLIIRQSCLKSAVEFMATHPEEKNIFNLAETMEEWVLR